MYFPEHLAIEILSYLSYDFLEEIMSQRQRWSALSIRNQSFQKKQFLNSKKQVLRHRVLLGLALGAQDRIIFPDDIYAEIPIRDILNHEDHEGPIQVPTEDQPLSGAISGSCDGLILLTNPFRPEFCAIWDPSMHSFRALPLLIEFLQPPFGLERSSYSIGFDNRSEKYKVIAVCNYQSGDMLHNLVYAYAIGTNSWKSIPELPTPYLFFKEGVHLAGALYYLVSDFTGENFVIFALNLDNESYSQILLPANIIAQSVGVLEEKLCVISKPNNNIAELFVFNHSESVWIQNYSIPTPLDPPIPVSFVYEKVLFVHGARVLLYSSLGLTMFNSEDDTLRFLPVHNFPYWRYARVCVYQPSFLEYKLQENLFEGLQLA